MTLYCMFADLFARNSPLIRAFFPPDAHADGSRIPDPLTPTANAEAALQSGLFTLVSSDASLRVRS